MSGQRAKERTLLGSLALGLLLGGASAAPQILSFTCTPGIVDARLADVTVNCAVRIVDKDSPIDYVYTRVRSPSGKFSLPLYFNGRRSIGLTSFTGANMVTTFTIPRHAEPGFWQIDYDGQVGFQAVNQNGDKTVLTGTDAAALGLHRFLKVYSPDDTVPPYLKDVVCNSPLEQNNPKVEGLDVSCRFTVVDQGSGASMVRATFIAPVDPKNPTAERMLLTINADADSGLISAKDGEYLIEGKAVGYPGMPGGNWTMLAKGPFAPYVEDKNLNGFTYDGINPDVIFSGPGFEVDSTPDVVPPVLQKFTCSATQVIVPADGSDAYTCQLIVQDDNSGFKYGEIVFESPDRRSTMVLRFDGNTRQVQFARGGVYAPQLLFTPKSTPGMWTASAQGLVLYDNAGNVARFSPAELNDRQFPSFVLVTKIAAKNTKSGNKSAGASLQASYGTLLACVMAWMALRRMV